MQVLQVIYPAFLILMMYLKMHLLGNDLGSLSSDIAPSSDNLVRSAQLQIVECPSSQSEATAQVLQTAAGTSDIASTRIDMPVTSRLDRHSDSVDALVSINVDAGATTQTYCTDTSVFSPAQKQAWVHSSNTRQRMAGASTPQPAASTASAASAASTTASLMNMNHDMDEEMLLFDSPSPSAMWALSDNQESTACCKRI
ncbi:hypothetical protein BASA81_015212 [Batrachochytrium salamandrivorans]|nr:hypothetical protein BASA81_015212 [Batrachochytrium salamandrivorans]